MALRGLKVVEMAGLAPVPFAGMILAGEGRFGCWHSWECSVWAWLLVLPRGVLPYESAGTLRCRQRMTHSFLHRFRRVRGEGRQARPVILGYTYTVNRNARACTHARMGCVCTCVDQCMGGGKLLCGLFGGATIPVRLLSSVACHDWALDKHCTQSDLVQYQCHSPNSWSFPRQKGRWLHWMFLLYLPRWLMLLLCYYLKGDYTYSGEVTLI